MSKEAPGRTRKAIKKLAPSSFKDNLIRTFKSFISSVLAAVLVVINTDITDTQGMKFAALTAAVNFVLNLILRWASTK